MSKSMKVKIKRQFPNPLTGRKAKVDEEINVPKNQFWLKRIEQKDCEEIKKKKAKAKAADKKADRIADVQK